MIPAHRRAKNKSRCAGSAPQKEGIMLPTVITIVAVIVTSATSVAAAILYFKDAVKRSSHRGQLTTYWLAGFAAHATSVVVLTTMVAVQGGGPMNWVFVVVIALTPYIGSWPSVRLITRPAADI